MAMYLGVALPAANLALTVSHYSRTHAANDQAVEQQHQGLDKADDPATTPPPRPNTLDALLAKPGPLDRFAKRLGIVDKG